MFGLKFKEKLKSRLSKSSPRGVELYDHDGKLIFQSNETSTYIDPDTTYRDLVRAVGVGALIDIVDHNGNSITDALLDKPYRDWKTKAPRPISRIFIVVDTYGRAIEAFYNERQAYEMCNSPSGTRLGLGVQEFQITPYDGK